MRYSSRIDGYALDLESITDDDEKAVGVHEYPFADTVDLDDMGPRAKRLSFRAWFLNENYPTHEDLLQHIRTRDMVEIVHPAYGVMSGKVSKASITHSDYEDAAYIDFEFIVAETPSSERKTERVTASAEDAYTQSVAAVEEQLKSDLEAQAGTDMRDAMAQEIDPESPILDQVTGVGSAVRTVVKKIDSDVRKLEGLMLTVSNPANSLVSSLNFAGNLPGRVIGAVSRTVERYTEALKAAADTPSQFVNSLKNSLGEIKSQVQTVGDVITVIGVQQGAVSVAEMYEADQQERAKQSKQEKAQAFAYDGTFLATNPADQIYTINELEASLYSIRELIQDAIDTGVNDESLHAMARALFQHVNTIKLERERLVSITVNRPTPLHAICQKYGLPYTYAERIMSVNPGIRNPSFVEGKILIYAK